MLKTGAGLTTINAELLQRKYDSPQLSDWLLDILEYFINVFMENCRDCEVLPEIVKSFLGSWSPSPD